MTTDIRGPLAHSPDNQAPPDADPLVERLARDHADLIDAAADIEIDAFKLPERIVTDEDAAAFTDFVARINGTIKKAEASRVEEKEPYLQGGKKIDAFFAGVKTDLEKRSSALLGILDGYKRAKAEAERAARLERERIEREESEARRRAEAEARQAAEAAERESQEAAARIRSATDAEERAAAEARMAEQAQEAAAQRRNAEEAATAAAEADRLAAANAKAAAKPSASKMTAGGASAVATTFWNHRIKDADALIASMGPIGRYINSDAIASAINAIKREHSAAGTMDTLSLPGVEFFQDQRTAVRTAPAGKKKLS